VDVFAAVSSDQIPKHSSLTNEPNNKTFTNKTGAEMQCQYINVACCDVKINTL
jgi:hypothetical protein